MFEQIEMAAPDAILGINEAFRADPNPARINLSVGVYKDSQGATPVLASVKTSEERLLAGESTKSYLGIDGIPEYGRLVREMLFGTDCEIIAGNRAVTIQSPGGTGALRVAGDFLHANCPSSSIWFSTPTWANHLKVFGAAEMATHQYAYFDAAANGLDCEALLADLRKIPSGDVVCLHACCHNPTGVDPTAEQWSQIGETVYERGLIPLLDFAYQGFGDGLVEDTAGLRAFCRPGAEFLVASSFSKNFSLYRERVGALTVVTADANTATTVLSQLKSTIRTNYSNPPAHGAQIVQTILENADLKAQWEGELAEMRERINGMRNLFAETMAAKCPDRDFSFLKRGRGMFAFSGLTPEQVDRLKEEHSVYMVRNGRINVAGMTETNMDPLCSAIAAVL
ncbi:MAG: aromatic amino acid aminotransferase [Planctomycetaceae bacterium]|nr:aromatic amino acid aminotransferase [Planctomycetaceae bacterium]